MDIDRIKQLAGMHEDNEQHANIKENTQRLEDAYIVVDRNPRYQSVVLITFDRNEAEEYVGNDNDYRVVQVSGKEFPTSFNI